MQFLDEAKIFVRSGNGGKGCSSFRREKHVPRGGPDGGNGGRGGHVIFRCVPGLNTLIDFRYEQHFKAPKGQSGQGRNRDGSRGEDMYINVPVGTQLYAEDKETVVADFTEVGQELLLLEGGQGGLGNTNFKSSTNQAPRYAQSGEEGKEMWLWLKLKLISDAGLLGLPNAGKSTFLGQVSRARPKVADYPFTTLEPKLGVVYIDEKEFVLSDIPGLIRGAADGHGLGHQFLRHIERCGVLLHLLDGTSETLLEDYETIVDEITQYGQGLADKPRVVAINKVDALIEEIVEEHIEQLRTRFDGKIFVISAATGEGVKEVVRELSATIDDFRKSLEPAVDEEAQDAEDFDEAM